MAKKRGPKPLHGDTMVKKVVTLDEMTLRKLRVLGEGNVSAGVRKAADVAFKKYQSSPDVLGS
jgi:hypothetical protein